MKKYLFIFTVALVLSGCQKDNSLSKDAPELPQTSVYDLNGDSVEDIKIEYLRMTWDGVNASGDLISGMLVPLNGSSILLKKDEPALFSKSNDTIKTESEEPLYWEKNLHPHLVTVSNSSENGFLWPNKWSIYSNLVLKTYFFGIKTSNNDKLLGWVEVKIDVTTGAVRIINKKFTSDSYIIVGK
jgi:hypothetical protein